MINRKTLYALGCCLVVFAASFAGTIVARSQPSFAGKPRMGTPLVRWLDLDEKAAEEIQNHDPQFPEEMQSLQRTLAEARSTLATLLDDESVANDRIREQVETCITQHNALERRVTEYLLAVRDHLTTVQQRKLFHLCANGVRKGRRHGWGSSAGRMGGGPGRCETCGRGGGGRGRPGNHDGG